jgi:diguanylate cyclase (GGDEF)-like protein
MISTTDTASDPLQQDRLVIVTAGIDEGDLPRTIERRYPDCRVAVCASYLAGIAEVARRPARAVIACVTPSVVRLEDAVAGLREAAGDKTRLVLCCSPESEPETRQAVRHGADDYVLYPIEGHELDAALGYGRPDTSPGLTLTPAPHASTEELRQLSELIAHLGAKPMILIERLAALVQAALQTRGATVIVEGAVATAGDPVTKPLLSAPLTSDDRVIGQLTIGEPLQQPYTPADVQKLTHYATMASHILRAASKQRQWHELALTDECSGLPNRRYLHERLDEILAEAAAKKFAVTVLIFDLDDFKTFNDTYGHDAGDEIIRITGGLFRQHCREQDVVVRYGGDEFVVVFWDPEGPRVAGSKHPDCALRVLERFKEALRSQRFPTLGPEGKGLLTISGGLATYPWDGSSREDLLKRADEALLAAKRAGKNRIFLIGHEHPDA